MKATLRLDSDNGPRKDYVNKNRILSAKSLDGEFERVLKILNKNKRE